MFVRKNQKDKKKEKSDKMENGDKLVDPLSVIVIGPSTSAGEKIDSSDIPPTKAAHFASSHPLSSEFTDFKDQLSFHFTGL